MELKKIDRTFYEKVGENLYRHRKKRGYSLRYLAELTGISSTTLDNYELGKARVTDDNWKIICEALQIDSKIDVSVTVD